MQLAIDTNWSYMDIAAALVFSWLKKVLEDFSHSPLSAASLSYLFLGNPFGLMFSGFLLGMTSGLSVRYLNGESEKSRDLPGIIAAMVLRGLLSLLGIAVILALLILSALPYGGGSHGLFALFKIALVAMPFWWGYAIRTLRRHEFRIAVLRREEAEALQADRPTWKRRFAGATLIVSLTFGFTLLLVSQTTSPEAPVETARKESARKAAAVREEGIWKCSKEIENIPDRIVVDSVLIDPGIIESKNVLHDLLGERGISALELKAYRSTQASGRDELAVRGGGQYSHGSLATSDDLPYVRLELARKGDSNCIGSGSFFSLPHEPHAPFSPEACLRATWLAKPSASHSIHAEQIAGDTDYFRWVLADRSNGAVLASLISSGSPLAPIRGGGGNASERKKADRGTVSCRDPFYSLTNILVGKKSPEKDRLALVGRVVPANPPDLSEGETEWSTIAVSQSLVSDWAKPNSEHRATAPWGKDWREAYSQAQHLGWANAAGGFVDYPNGELVRFSPPKLRGAHVRGYIVASPLGFAFLFRDLQLTRLALYSREGKLIWKGTVASDRGEESGKDNFDPVAISWKADGIRAYGFRYDRAKGANDVLVRFVPFKLLVAVTVGSRIDK